MRTRITIEFDGRALATLKKHATQFNKQAALLGEPQPFSAQQIVCEGVLQGIAEQASLVTILGYRMTVR